MDLMFMQVVENRRKLKMTVLRREGGMWHPSEITKLAKGLGTEVSYLESQPEYVVLFGHHTKEDALKAILGGEAFTASQIVGTNSPDLPFLPNFA